jgi:MFS family permease
MDVKIFRDRVFLMENIVLGLAMIVFVPVFFFASEYAQLSLGETASKASLVLLYFFIGFVIAAQIGGRMLDRGSARRPIVYGCALACVAFVLWADRVTDLTLSHQVWFIVLAGAGMGLMLGQANTDAINQAPNTSYGEATGITQTVRNFGSSLGLAVLGTILVTMYRDHLSSSFIAQGLRSEDAHREAGRVSQLGGGPGNHGGAIPHFVQVDFAHATQTVLYVMAAVIGVAGLVALRGLPRRRTIAADEAPAGAVADATPSVSTPREDV